MENRRGSRYRKPKGVARKASTTDPINKDLQNAPDDYNQMLKGETCPTDEYSTFLLDTAAHPSIFRKTSILTKTFPRPIITQTASSNSLKTNKIEMLNLKSRTRSSISLPTLVNPHVSATSSLQMPSPKNTVQSFSRTKRLTYSQIMDRS